MSTAEIKAKYNDQGRGNIPVVNIGRAEEILHGVDISPEVGQVVWLGSLANEVTKLFYLKSEGRLWTERQFNSRNCKFV